MTSHAGTRTTARVIPLVELMQRAWSGEVRVPHFRRAFSWNRAQVAQLVDSVCRSFPIGSLLLWERPADAQRITLGALAIEAPALDRALWVVDGQQRIASLANVLHPDGALDDRFALGYDLRSSRVGPLPAADDAGVVPLPVLFDVTRTLRWLADHPEASEYRETVFDVALTLRDYALPTYEIRQDDMQVMQVVFERLNSTGKALTRAEVYAAVHAPAGAGAGPGRTFADIAAEIDERRRFGHLDDDTVLQCVLARRGPDTAREIRYEFDDPAAATGDFPGEGRDVALARGGQAVDDAVAFLVAAGVPHYTFLPYRYLLVVLTRFVALHPTLRPTEQRLLRRWFWRAAVVGPGIDRGGTTGLTRSLCRQIRPGPAMASINRLLAVFDDEEPAMPYLPRFRVNTAEGKILLCSWWQLEPRRPDTGTRYDRGEIAQAVGDEATPADAVRWIFPVRFTQSSEFRWAADRVLMPVLDESLAEVSGLLQRRPRTVPEERWPDVLRSHLISPEAYRFLTDEDVERFVERRHDDVLDHLRTFLALKCEWGFENTPPLRDLDLDDLDDDDVAR